MSGLTRMRRIAPGAAFLLIAVALASLADQARAGKPASPSLRRSIVAAQPPGALVVPTRALDCHRTQPLVASIDGNRLGVLRAGPRRRIVKVRTTIGAGRHSVSIRRVHRSRERHKCRVVVGRPRFQPRSILLGAAVREYAFADRAYTTTVDRYFDSVTPENEMKLTFLQPAQGRFDFSVADRLVDQTRALGKRIRGHALIYGDQLPDWLEKPPIPWTRARLLATMRDHIHTVMTHYRGRVQTWDVVNEPFDVRGGYLPNLWYRVIGPDYVEQALRFAHAANPDAQLFINENAAEFSGPKARTLRTGVGILKRRGVPLNGVGFQNHTAAPGHPSYQDLKKRLASYNGLGLVTEITEMDLITAPGTRRTRLRRHAAAYRAAARACRAVRTCQRLTTWGVSDQITWRRPVDLPLLFGATLSPRPAYGAVAAQLGPR